MQSALLAGQGRLLIDFSFKMSKSGFIFVWQAKIVARRGKCLLEGDTDLAIVSTGLCLSEPGTDPCRAVPS